MPKLETEEPLYTAKEMADFLKVSQPTLDTWRKAGVIPCVWQGYIIRYERAKVLEALRKVQRKGGSR
jgi:predicted site-specific integrase-resolvase